MVYTYHNYIITKFWNRSRCLNFSPGFCPLVFLLSELAFVHQSLNQATGYFFSILGDLLVEKMTSSLATPPTPLVIFCHLSVPPPTRWLHLWMAPNEKKIQGKYSLGFKPHFLCLSFAAMTSFNLTYNLN